MSRRGNDDVFVDDRTGRRIYPKQPSTRIYSENQLLQMLNRRAMWLIFLLISLIGSMWVGIFLLFLVAVEIIF
jgi:hypothetical protein